MSSDIQFKFWCNYSKRWLCPDEYMVGSKGEVYRVTKYEFDNVVELNEKAVAVRYTGFKDNNDVDYYEDDLISNNLGTDKETIRQVKFIHGCWMLSRIKGASRLPKNIEINTIVGLNWPIIGSIHSNPELLS